MYAILRVLDNGTLKKLIFLTESDAKNFRKFILFKMTLFGGNGYESYWLSDENDILLSKENISKRLESQINLKYIYEIANDISHCSGNALKNGRNKPDYMPKIGIEDGCITFEFDPNKLPRPAYEEFLKFEIEKNPRY